MASLFFSVAHGRWRCKWRARNADGSTEWRTVTLCEHPGWVRPKDGKRGVKPKKEPPEAIRLFRKYQDMELEANHGVTVADVRPALLADFLTDYLRATEVSQAEGTHRVTTREAERFRDWCKSRGITTIPGVTPEVCRTYLEDLCREFKRDTVRTAKGLLAPAWELAFHEGKLASNPWRRARVPGKSRRERPPFWTEQEIDRLADACAPLVADIVRVGFGSGLRIAALLALQWRDVDFARSRIHVRAASSKSGKHYDAPMIGKARDALQRKAATEETTGLVFKRPDGKRIWPTSTYKAIRRAVKATGIPDHGHYNHILRHSFATWAVAKGAPLRTVSTWLGHASIVMTEKYAHADPAENQRWADHLTNQVGETPSPPATGGSPDGTG